MPWWLTRNRGLTPFFFFFLLFNLFFFMTGGYIGV